MPHAAAFEPSPLPVGGACGTRASPFGGHVVAGFLVHERIFPASGEGTEARGRLRVGLISKNFDGTARLLLGGSLVAAAALLSGCMSSPTYGTDKTANAQLMSDMGGILSFRDKKKAAIEYAPRPELVKPAKGQETLPPPQDSVATASNPNWPESPEQRLARLRAEADANLDNPNYNSPIVPDMVSANPKRKTLTGNGRAEESGVQDVSQAAAQKAEYQKRVAETQQGSSQTRKYLERAADRLPAGRRRCPDRRTRRGRVPKGTPPEARSAQEERRLLDQRPQPILSAPGRLTSVSSAVRGRNRAAGRPIASRPFQRRSPAHGDRSATQRSARR